MPISMNEKFNFNRENGASSLYYEEKNLSPLFFMQKLVI